MQDTLQKEKKKPRYDFAVWLLFWEKGVFLFEVCIFVWVCPSRS